ncbi:MAG TPA: hypothetical protein VFP46_01375, partial [Candidatus Paceibacterota bacterium]|nr:hypothetical protein [Candidatus Paceibacterota bacterium]
MAYHLKFVDSPPTLELSVPEETWDALRIEIDVSRLREIRDYLDGKAVWVWTRGHAGFGRCGTIERKDGVVHARFRLFARSVRNTVLTLSFLFDALYPMNRDDEFFLVHTSCG